MNKLERKRAAQYEQRKIRCLEDMARGKIISEVTGSISILSDLLGCGYVQVVREYSDVHYQYRDIGITDSGRVYLEHLQMKPKSYTVGPNGGVKLLKGE